MEVSLFNVSAIIIEDMEPLKFPIQMQSFYTFGEAYDYMKSFTQGYANSISSKKNNTKINCTFKELPLPDVPQNYFAEEYEANLVAYKPEYESFSTINIIFRIEKIDFDFQKDRKFFLLEDLREQEKSNRLQNST